MGYGADEIYTRSALRSLQLWRELFARVGEPLFHQTGVLWLAHEDDPYPVKTAETLQELGVPFERLTPAEVSRCYPQIGLARIAWAMFEPGSGVLSARRAVQAVTRAASANGVEFLQDVVTGTGVRGPQRDRASANPAGLLVAPVNHAQDAPATARTLNEITTASGRRISAGHYVFACGPWLPKIFPSLLSDRIHPTRQEVFYFGAPAGNQSFTSTALPTWIDFKDEAYGLPDLEGHGVKLAIDRHGSEFDPDDGDRHATRLSIREYCQRRFFDRSSSWF